jgi:hypothetical protein
MRTWLLVTVVFLLVATQSWADSEYGVKAGACHAERTLSYTQQGEGLVTLEHVRVGLCVGFFVRLRGSSPLSLLAEVQYVQKGIDGFTGHRVNCLCFPLLGRYDAHLGPGSVYAAVGPRADMYLDVETSEPRDLERVGFGVDVALGYQLGRASLEARYSGAPGRDAVPGGSEASGDVYQVLVGWAFRTGDQVRRPGVSEPPN